MAIYRAGQLNKLGLTNPGVYVIENLPQSQIVGVPTNYQGLVGVASWGPVGGVQSFSTLNDGVTKFGLPLVRQYDLMSHAMAGFSQGIATYYKGVRISDGTDVAATVLAPLGGTFTAMYTGVRGNNIQVFVQGSVNANTMAIVVVMPGLNPERWDNIPSSTPAIFWNAVAAAINNGTLYRGPSKYVTFTAVATPTLAPTAGLTYQLTGGTDGAATITTARLIGTDVRPRTGMYALRGSGCAEFNLCDCVDSSSWATQAVFAISEGMMAISATMSGDTIANAVAARATAGVDDPNIWILEGDWPTFYDSVNGVKRLVSPQAFGSGLLGNLSPEQSPINKPLPGVLGTQTSGSGVLVSDADEAVAQTGGIDFIGRSSALNVNYFTFMTGRNASSNTQANGVEFTRMENFLARSLNGIATTQLVGLLQSRQLVDPTRTKAKAILDSFGAQLKDPASGSNGYGMIEDWASICDKSNNPDGNIYQGILNAIFRAAFLNVVRYFIIDLQGGNNVSVTISPTQTVSGT